ncbi:YgdB family protein [Yersinia enterocolitica]|uniref:YgdB family protein n=1 Tax=Yersinia enterocolitica TaxID=630 RepID=UPI00031F1B9F|nr:YgdB family protein [Yersinia enterocolitica]HDL7917208.1 YgdB family protein [Yersinia enterocolitica]HDV5954086.1 YgdB family protein [Yersinia enterocolitica]HDV7153043.1 YgdB family protein [Yersinia enterocolitica]HED5570192.1 YgdB family protein [Yersinia enterocolitica]
MRLEQQRGTSTLAAIATLFALGLFLLSALHRQLDNIHKITAEEQRHLRAFNQATSSLNWGVTQNWSFSLPWLRGAVWHCHEQPQYGLKACIRPSSLAGFFILRGESQSFGTQPPLMLYQRTKLNAEQGNKGQYRLVKVAHGWLDFCPDKDAKFCL